VFLAHASEPNTSDRPRRGMTLRYMPTTSVYDRELATTQAPARHRRIAMAERTLYLMRGEDRSGGRNDYRMRS
ncbi:MAG: phytanoyl-CoA dioxygenase family protein, partial [Gammaproteobacteria bacterium]|nr:phytanoyl-CoA dioxygenase family protein [Gammaproteobacteria bacterium]